MPRPSFIAATLALAAGAAAHAQINVRAWPANGQVFVIWERTAAPAFPTETYEIFAAASPQPSIATMTRVGRLFEPEYTGDRLTQLQPGARLRIPTPGGGSYTLLPSEGAFAFTPRSTTSLFFAVVRTGSAVVNAANSTSVAFTYDPTNNPVRPHPQFSGFTTNGNPYTAFVVWADGRDDFNAQRPDFPVIADADKNGVPHVFTITRPINPLPAAPASCVFALHGGEGEYQLFRPGMPQRGNVQLQLNDGIVVTPDDSIFFNQESNLVRTNTSWFGYTPAFDPFVSSTRPDVPADAVVANFTQRRIHWILDWLQSPQSPVTIDPERVAIIGHSGGGRGTSHIARSRPERFAAAVIYTPASDLSIDDDGRINPLRGNWDQNLDTNLALPGQPPIGVADLFTMTTRLSPERDFPLTRFYYGKRDQDGAASWTTAQRTVIDNLNNSGAGFMILWDEREHGVEKWTTETNDATDGNPGPWPDLAQWLTPVRTQRAAAQYLVDTYRASQSYPGFFNADQDPILSGRQPDPGPGDPNLGEPWGTWSGFFDWETSTIIDTPDRWEITLFAVGLSSVSVDNAPVDTFLTDLSPRKTRSFAPAEGSPAHFQLRDPLTAAMIATGPATIGTEGLATVTGIGIPRDPERVRLIIALGCGPADLNTDGAADLADFFAFFNAYDSSLTPADINADGSVDLADFFEFFSFYDAGC